MGLELSLTLVPSAGGIAVAILDDQLPLLARVGLLAAALVMAGFALPVLARPVLEDDAIVLRVGPLTRRHPVASIASMSVGGDRVVIVGQDGSARPILTPARFADAEGLRASLREWARARDVELS